MGYLIFLAIYIAINIYWTKITWSFYIRLVKGHEILIIHGKYLEKMMNDESYKISDVKKYAPPDQLNSKTASPLNNDSELSIFKKTEK